MPLDRRLRDRHARRQRSVVAWHVVVGGPELEGPLDRSYDKGIKYLREGLLIMKAVVPSLWVLGLLLVVGANLYRADQGDTPVAFIAYIVALLCFAAAILTQRSRAR